MRMPSHAFTLSPSPQHKIYKEWKKVVEDMTAEERLMRNIPKNVTKVGALL